MHPTAETAGNEECEPAQPPHEDTYNIPREEDSGLAGTPTRTSPALRKLINKPNIMSPSLNLARLTQRSLVSSPQQAADRSNPVLTNLKQQKHNQSQCKFVS